MSRIQTAACPTTFDANFITKTFFPRIWDAGDVDRINRGQCYDWAYYAYCLFPEAQLWTNFNHAWVESNGLFFDSKFDRGADPASDLLDPALAARNIHGVPFNVLSAMHQRLASRKLPPFWNIKQSMYQWEADRYSHWVEVSRVSRVK